MKACLIYRPVKFRVCERNSSTGVCVRKCSVHYELLSFILLRGVDLWSNVQYL